MGNKVARIVLGIIIICAVAVGVFFILPGQYKNPLIQKFQESTDPYSVELVNALSSATIPKNKKKTYGEAMLAATASPAWTIKKINVDKDTGNGTYEVYADGYKCTISMENENNSDGMKTFTEAHVRLIFLVTKNGSELKIKDKVFQSGKAATPNEIVIDEYNYKESDGYFQKALNCLADAVQK